VVLYAASRYADSAGRDRFLERGRYFHARALQELSRHKTAAYTRPLALIMQNGWLAACLGNDAQSLAPPPRAPAAPAGRPTPYLSLGAVLLRSLEDLAHAAGSFSLKRELSWMRQRLVRARGERRNGVVQRQGG
jgi:hypothetical protein